MRNNTLTVYLTNDKGRDCYVWLLPKGRMWAIETQDRQDAMRKVAIDFKEFFDTPDIDEDIGKEVTADYGLPCPWEIRRIDCTVWEVANRQHNPFDATIIESGEDIIADFLQA